MKLVHPRVEVLDYLDETPPLDRIEVCGRTSYKSEGRIKDGSSAKFVKALIDRKHLSVLEHHRFVLKWEAPNWGTNQGVSAWLEMINEVQQVQEYCEGLMTECQDKTMWLSWNARTLIEARQKLVRNRLVAAVHYLVGSKWPDLFSNLPPNSDLPGWESVAECLNLVKSQTVLHGLKPEKSARLLPATMRFVVDRGVSHELVRHRKMSPTQESTRYVRYGSDKGGVSFVIPNWVEIQPRDIPVNESLEEVSAIFPSLTQADAQWVTMVATSELQYLAALENSWTPQQARSSLCHSVKTEVCLTGTIERWRTLLSLRVADDAHPQAAQVAVPALRWFQARPVYGPYFRDVVVGEKWKDLRLAEVIDLVPGDPL